MTDPPGFVIVSLGGEGDCQVEGQRYCILRVQGPFKGHGPETEAAFRAAEEAGEYPHWLPLEPSDSLDEGTSEPEPNLLDRLTDVLAALADLADDPARQAERAVFLELHSCLVDVTADYAALRRELAQIRLALAARLAEGPG